MGDAQVFLSGPFRILEVFMLRERPVEVARDALLMRRSLLEQFRVDKLEVLVLRRAACGAVSGSAQKEGEGGKGAEVKTHDMSCQVMPRRAGGIPR